MFVLLVELEAVASREAELERVLRWLVETARTEPSVLFYAIQRPEGEPGKFVLYEYYESKAAWQMHLAFEPVKARTGALRCVAEAAGEAHAVRRRREHGTAGGISGARAPAVHVAHAWPRMPSRLHCGLRKNYKMECRIIARTMHYLLRSARRALVFECRGH